MTSKTENPPFYVGVVVIDSTRRFMLLGKRREDGIWTGPGGSADLGESPKQTAIRECYEEANLKIKPYQLKELPTLMTESGKLVHCFMVFVDKSELKSLHTSNDPDAEVREWGWYKINDPLPGKTDPNRLLTMNAAKMKILGLRKSELAKAIVSNPDADIDLNTAEEAQQELAAEDSPWLTILRNELEGIELGELPREIPLPSKKLLLVSKVDDGIYSAFVRNDDPEDGDYGLTLTQLSKMTPVAMVQALKAKEYLPIEMAEKEETVPEPTEDAKTELAQILSGLTANNGEIHIHIHKALLAEELDRLAKGRKPMAVGTVRTWSNGIKAVKHADGWVVLGGAHHGKMMGEFKGEATHKDFADEHKDKADLKEIEGGGQDTSPDAAVERIKADVARRKAEMTKPKDQESSQERKESDQSEPIPEAKEESQPEEKAAPIITEAEIDRILSESKSREFSDSKARLTIEPEFIIEERGGYIKMGDGSKWEGMTFFPSSPEHMRAIAQRDIDNAKSWQQSYKLTQKQWLAKFKEMERISGRLSKWQKHKAVRMHMNAISDAVKSGLIKVDSKIPSEYPTLQENLGFKPEPAPLQSEFQTEAQKKTNMIGGTNFKAATKEIREQLNKNLNDANVLIAEMGITFKTPITFACTPALKSTRDLGGHYSDHEKQIVIRNKNRFNKTLMHEIGHAVDYAMQDKRVAGRGVQRSQGRSAEAQTESPMSSELKTKYAELHSIITSSSFYESLKGESGRFGENYYKEPTEVFARAFEVYSRVKAEEAVKAGKISPEFLDSFVPDVYQEKDPALASDRKKYDQLIEAAKDKERLFKRLRSADKEVRSKALDAANEAYREASSFYNERLRGQSLYRDVAPEKRKEYESKITEIMDYILKNDEIRKALALILSKML